VFVQAFSAGKDPEAPEANEDTYVVVPGRLYAVIDGVTDATGRRYDGASGGQLAGRAVEQALRELAGEGGHRDLTTASLLARLNAAFHDTYRRHGIAAAAGTRIGATLVLVADAGPVLRFFVIGDSGLRLNGRTAVRNEMAIDRIFAALRQRIYRRLRAAGADETACAAVARAGVCFGTDAVLPEMVPWLDAAALAELRAATRAQIAAQLPAVAAADLDHLLARGVVGAQGDYRNRAGHALGYACLDGYPVPPELVVTLERPKAETATVEMFTDGYFHPPSGCRLADWEESFAAVERLDPTKTEAYPAEKGSLGRVRTDDRTVVILSRDPPS
jgi:hypothetical protein